MDNAMSDKLWIGVDPGKSGAIAFVTDGWSEPWFVKNNETLTDLVDTVRDSLKNGSTSDTFAVIEKVHSSPQMGVRSAFTFGESYGQLTALLVALGIPYEVIRPQLWQKSMQCLTGGDKNITKAKAQALYPKMKITHANADALLIATYCKRNF